MTDAARAAAADCLRAVEEDGAYANLAMPGILRSRGLAGRDAGFAVELAYGALRMHRLYDEVLAAAARRPADRIEPELRRLMWLGAHQALSMRVPVHAAVSETVSAARAVVGARATGFVNAVMRRVTERDREGWLAEVAPGDSLPDLAIRHSHPDWVVEELADALEAEGRRGELSALLAAHNDAARVTLCARPGLVAREDLANEVGGSPTALSPFGVALAGGAPGDIAAVRDGRAGVQDEGSQLVAAASVADAGAGLWLDACAGPGGKAALLGALAAERGATLAAWELHPHRTDLVRQAIRALPPGTVSVETRDATEPTDARYDRIVLDAPCTGLGALRRRPESRWRRTPADLADLVATQESLLDAAFAAAAPGGVVAYITCSPVLAETRVQALAAAERHGADMLDARAAVVAVAGGAAGDFGTGPFVQLWTHVHGTDSMFLALMRAR